MDTKTTSTGYAKLLRLHDGKVFPLLKRLTTIGASAKCTIQVEGENVPEHCAHILFRQGAYSIAALHEKVPVKCNGKALSQQIELVDNVTVEIAGVSFTFKNSDGETTAASTSATSSPLRKFIQAVARYSRLPNKDLRSEMLAGIAQLLASDGARLVAETAPGQFATIARYPESSGLDRFSQRALLWVKKDKATVLMRETDWHASRESKGSLELNEIGSIICTPLIEGGDVRGYLYLDKKSSQSPFTQDDREILEDVAPLFGDLLALYERTLRQEETIARLQGAIEEKVSSIIYRCDAMQQAIDLAMTFAVTDSTVLVTGETGTGKELFAKLIHDHSSRSSTPFFAINCGAIPENLIESELFGHEKGAFTGAHQKKGGLFEKAHGGTVFLDEIGEMPLSLQVKLLRVLQEGEITPLGATAPVKVDVRIIAATNRDLLTEVKQAKFREDLYYRLAVLAIHLPPLRNRDRDVIIIADAIISKYSQRFGLERKALSLSAQAMLLRYTWPGNIRQLDNVMQKALLLAKGNLIGEGDLDIADTVDQRMPPNPVTGLSCDEAVVTLKDARAYAEKKCIADALKRANGNVSVAARLVETDRKWFTKLMKLYGISNGS